MKASSLPLPSTSSSDSSSQQKADLQAAHNRAKLDYTHKPYQTMAVKAFLQGVKYARGVK